MSFYLTLNNRNNRIESGCEICSILYSKNDLKILSSQSSKKGTKYIMEKIIKVRAFKEFIKLFKDSNSISNQSGISYFLIKELGKINKDATPKTQENS